MCKHESISEGPENLVMSCSLANEKQKKGVETRHEKENENENESAGGVMRGYTRSKGRSPKIEGSFQGLVSSRI